MKNRQPARREALGEQVDRLTNEVEVLRESVDELKTALEWAIRTARLTVQFEDMAKPLLAPPAKVELFEIGDGVRFDIDGIDYAGEIVELNDGENLATVRLIPSSDTLGVIQDHLTRIENDPLSYRKNETCRESGQAEATEPLSSKGGRQLTLDFEGQATHEAAEPFIATEPLEPNVVSKEAFTARTRTIWNAVNAWLIDYSPAIGFDAFKLGVFEKIEPESHGTFSDADQVRLLKDDYALACGIAIAVEDAALTMEEHGLDEDAESLLRTYYLAIALATAGFDLEHYLPGFPVHSMKIS